MSSGTFNQAVRRAVEIYGATDCTMDQAVIAACDELGGVKEFVVNSVKSAATDEWSDAARKAAAAARSGRSKSKYSNEAVERRKQRLEKNVIEARKRLGPVGKVSLT